MVLDLTETIHFKSSRRKFKVFKSVFWVSTASREWHLSCRAKAVGWMVWTGRLLRGLEWRWSWDIQIRRFISVLFVISKYLFSRWFSRVSRRIFRAFISYGIAKYSWRMLIESVDLFGSTLLWGRHSLLPSSAILFLNPRTWCWGTLAWWALQLPSFNKHTLCSKGWDERTILSTNNHYLGRSLDMLGLDARLYLHSYWTYFSCLILVNQMGNIWHDLKRFAADKRDFVWYESCHDYFVLFHLK